MSADTSGEPRAEGARCTPAATREPSAPTDRHAPIPPCEEPAQRTPLADHVADAVALLAAVRRTERIAVDGSAVARVAAADRRAAVDVPGHDNSQMDGYAVATADLHATGADSAARTVAGSVTLPLAATIAAGDAPSEHRPGTAAPIMTGAPIPHGADAVIPVEESERGSFDGSLGSADRTPSTVALRPAATAPGRFVRPRGSDTHQGDVILREGQVLTPARIAHLAACGVGEVEVIAPVRAVVLSTGSEVTAPSAVAPSTLPEGATFDANGPGLAAALTAAGARVVHTGSVPDDARALLETLREVVASSDADLIVTSGGVSKGAFEVVRQAAELDGTTLAFTSVAMQPGGPQGIGTLNLAGEDAAGHVMSAPDQADATAPVPDQPDRTATPGRRIPWLAFPGNPVSALLSCELIARPALGAPDRTRLRLPIQLEAEEPSPAALTQFRRARVLPSGQVRLVGGPSSHLIGGLAQADALVVVPAGVDALRDGDQVETILLPGGER